MTGRVFSLFLSLAVSLVAAAQPSTAVASRDAMLYETSTHLCLQADTLTCISMDMEWPKGLNGSLLPELQRSLTTFFFGQPSDSYEAGRRSFLSAHGEEIQTIEEGKTFIQRYCEMHLRCLWLEPGRYISFLARMEKCNESSVVVSNHSYFTFDLLNNRMLTQKDVFNQTRLWQNAGIRYQFCEVLDTTSNASPFDSIDWDRLPGQFALMGQRTLFDLGADNAGGVWSEVDNAVIDVLFSKNFKKWLKQPIPLASREMLPAKDIYLSSPDDSLSVESQAQFEGNIAAAIGRNIPYTDLQTGPVSDGKVYVSFIVDKDASLKDIVFLTVRNIRLNRAVASALQMLYGWKPAVRNGEPVARRYFLPLILHFK